MSNAQKKLENLNSPPLLIDCLINSSFFVKAMIDTGCLCFSVLDEDLVRTNKLYSEVITPRLMRLADGQKSNRITQIARVEVDIDGIKEQIWGYVMPNLAYSIILGKPWMESNSVTYSARRQCLRIGSRKHGIVVRASGWYEKRSPIEVRNRVSNVGVDQVAMVSKSEFANLLQQTQGTIGMGRLERQL
ncbi:hypothetical protein K3495_g15965 [Podosphaera aphanis]|nr:hypothetical protein K3495_g15965 [Podosphaera aphanis]